MNHHKILMFGTMLCLLGLGCSDTAYGQVTVSPTGGLNFQVQSGGASATQTLNVSTPNATTLVITVPSGQTWLTVNNVGAGSTFFPNTPGGNNPVALQVKANTLGFNQGQVLSANLTIAILNEPSTQVTYPVSLTVGTPSLLTANPANLTFSAVTGSSFGTPLSTPVTISSSGAALNYNITITTANTQNWLLVTNTQNIPTNSTTPGFSVSVNAQNLAVGTYTGTILAQSTTTGDSITIPVTLSVTAGAALNVTGTLNNFIFQSGSLQGNFSSETQTLMVSTSSGSLNYQVTATSPTGPTPTTNWLLISPNGGLATTSPQAVNLSLASFSALATLTPGTYTITVVIAPTAGAGAATNVLVTLVVSNNALLTVNNSSLTFSIPFGTTTTQSQTVQVTSSNGTSIPYAVQSNASWLSASPINGTTASNSVLTVTVNASGLNVQAAPYTGTLTLNPQNSDFGLYSVQINVTLTVTSAVTAIYAAPAQLLFSDETTLAPPGLQIVELSSSANLPFSVTTTQMNASNCPTGSWLSAVPNQYTTPATLSVGVLTNGMTAGYCTGNVIITYNNGVNANTTVIIPVTVAIAATPLLTITPDPGFGVVTATAGSTAAITSRISVNSTDGSPQGFQAFASTPNAPVSWLFLGSSQGTTQQYIQVQVLPGGLPVGVYTGSITINATNGATLPIPNGQFTLTVTLTVSASTTVTVSPASLSFTQAQGATTAPAAQTVTLTATGGTTGFTASVTPITGGTWLQVSPLSGTASGTITATVLTNTLSAGTYTSDIIVKFLNSATPTQTIPVSLTITSQAISASPASLTFAYQIGAAAPATQTINVTSNSGTLSFTASASSTPAWLAVTPASGTTGSAVTASVVPSVLTTAGTYNGTITITPAGGTAITVPVTLTVTGSAVPQPGTISNSASGAFGAIAPGELITIKGTNLGPATPAQFTLTSSGTVSSTLSGVQVLFDGIPGTPIYVSPTQINAIVPYEIAGRATTNVTVTYSGQTSAAIPQNVANQAPGIFTASSTGAGQASVLNQNGTLNGPAAGLVINGTNIATTPASVGSVIAIYMTGGGQTSPLSATGTVTPSTTLYKIPGTVTATINGVTATVNFAGAAPGLVTGVIQVNLTIPAGVTGSALPLAITINGSTTLAGPTIAVQ
jgi:uncharacterized protein (TIGR03437 family)